MSTPMPGKTQPKSENKYMSLPAHNQKCLRIHTCLLRTNQLEVNLSYKHIFTPLTSKNQPKLESKYMPMSSQTQQKSDNSPLPDKTINSEGEGRTTACKTYTPFSP